MRFGLLFGIVLAAACSPAGPMNEAERAAIEAAADSATRAFEAAQRARDPERAIAHLAPDFTMLGDGVRLPYDSVVASIRRTFGTLRHLEPGFTDLRARALGHDAALVSFTFHDSIVTQSGETLRLTGPTTLVWQRRGADWLITFADADHYPPAPR